MKTLLKILLTILLVIVAAFAALVLWLTLSEYRPAPVEDVPVLTDGSATGAVETGKQLKLLSWNIGYSGLGAAEDFFMDGGTHARSGSSENIYKYLNAISDLVKNSDADIVTLQEVDLDSTRSYHVNQKEVLVQGFSANTFALNYSCPFVPIPFPPLGKVNSGLLTLTDGLTVSSAKRVSLTCPFKWPVRIANLKRCLLVSYIPVKGSEKQLVIVDFHLEAYTEAENRDVQTEQLIGLISEEYAKGNYVIACGDFNQFMPGSREVYPRLSSDWDPSELDISRIPQGWTLAYDLSVPTCRALNRPLDPSDPTTQYYSIDGMILSPNVKMTEIKTLDKGFENSDHNPLELMFILN
ncbi:MAG: endonuclease/exonuclease/phosphatase family protein [Spirochaetales bacterium]|nr:endonuclease/exonuclease/phosphatase family protein [Spirochaetales bacterium]